MPYTAVLRIWHIPTLLYAILIKHLATPLGENLTAGILSLYPRESFEFVHKHIHLFTYILCYVYFSSHVFSRLANFPHKGLLHAIFVCNYSHVKTRRIHTSYYYKHFSANMFCCMQCICSYTTVQVEWDRSDKRRDVKKICATPFVVLLFLFILKTTRIGSRCTLVITS